MSGRAAPILDAGWLFVIAGLAMIGSVILIPAADDLAEARWIRDRALAVEKHRALRLERYQQFLGALDERDPALIRSLAASQLHKVPADMEVLPEDLHEGASASVFPGLEPPALVLPERRPVRSTLHTLATNDRSRVVLMAGGAFCILLGLLPGSRGPRTTLRRPHPPAMDASRGPDSRASAAPAAGPPPHAADAPESSPPRASTSAA